MTDQVSEALAALVALARAQRTELDALPVEERTGQL